MQSSVSSKASAHKSVYDCLPKEFDHPKLGVFGRLDIDTTGVLLLGTDGGLQSLITHPASKVTKAYIATLDPHCKDVFSPTAVDEFAHGVRLADGTVCEPAVLEVLETQSVPDGQDELAAHGGRLETPVSVRVRLHEGKYHQVKRMLGAVGGCVKSL